MSCVFFSGYLNECVALKVCDLKDCEGANCAFYKTKKEYSESRKRAADRLYSMGLVPYKKNVDGVQIMSVKKFSKKTKGEQYDK